MMGRITLVRCGRTRHLLAGIAALAIALGLPRAGAASGRGRADEPAASAGSNAPRGRGSDAGATSGSGGDKGPDTRGERPQRVPLDIAYVHGQVFDEMTDAPLAGATVTSPDQLPRQQTSDPASPFRWGGPAATDADGRFVLAVRLGGRNVLDTRVRIEMPGYTFVDRRTRVVVGRDSAVRAAYLTLLSTAGTLVTAAGGGTVDGAGGNVQLVIPPGALAQDTTVFITGVTERALAAKLPDDRLVDLGSLEIRPDIPSFPNCDIDAGIVAGCPILRFRMDGSGVPLGTELPVYSYDDQAARWDPPRKDTLVQDPDLSLWSELPIEHFSTIICAPRPGNQSNEQPPPAEPTTPGGICPKRGAVSGGSLVSIQSGNLQEEHALPAIRALNRPQTLRFVYNTSTANPSAVIGVDSDSAFRPWPVSFYASIEGRSFERKWGSIDFGRHHFAWLWDGTNGRGFPVPSGSYPYVVEQKNYFPSTCLYCRPIPPKDEFCVWGTCADGYDAVWRTIRRRVAVNRLTESPFGAGWGLAGLQRLYADPDGGAAITDGDGETIAFEPGEPTDRSIDLAFQNVTDVKETAFFGLSGEVVAIGTYSSRSFCVAVEDASGFVVYNACGQNLSDSLTLGGTGRYTVRVSFDCPNWDCVFDPTTVTLVVLRVAGRPLQPIQLGETLRGLLARSTAFKFAAGSGDQLLLFYERAAAGDLGCIELRDSLSRQVARTCGTDLSMSLAYSVPAAGDYTAILENQGSRPTVAFDFTALRLSDPPTVTAAVPYGVTVNGALGSGYANCADPRPDHDAYLIEGTAGDALSIYAPNDYGACFHLLDPAGNEIAGKCYGSSIDYIDVRLPSTGRYLLLVQLQAPATNTSYAFTVNRVDAGATNPRLEYGRPMRGAARSFRRTCYTGSLWSGDNDAYSFDGMQGDAIELSGGWLYSNGTRLIVRLYDPSGAFLADSYSGPDQRIRATLPTTGTYTATVSFFAGPPGDYGLTLRRLSSPATVDALIGYGETVYGRAERTDGALYGFDAVAGEVVWVGWTAPGSACAGTPCARVTVLDPAGAPVLDLSPGCPPIPQEAAVFTVATTGRYAVDLASCAEYALTIHRLSAPTSEEQTIAYGDTIEAVLGAKVGPFTYVLREAADLYAFNGAAGDVVALHSTNPSGCVTVYDPAGIEVLPCQRDEYLRVLTIPASGKYTVMVHPLHNPGNNWELSPGPYTLALSRLSPTTTLPTAALGVTQRSVLTKYDATEERHIDGLHGYAFDASAGDVVTIQAAPDGPFASNSTCLQLQDAAGAEIARDCDSVTASGDVTLRIPATGRYTVTVGYQFYWGCCETQDRTYGVTLVRHEPMATGDMLPAGKTLAGSIALPGDLDLYTFEGGGVSHAIHVDTTMAPVPYTACARVFAPGALTPLAQACGADINTPVLPAGTYVLIVEGNGAGPYDLSLDTGDPPSLTETDLGVVDNSWPATLETPAVSTVAPAVAPLSEPPDSGFDENEVFQEPGKNPQAPSEDVSQLISPPGEYSRLRRNVLDGTWTRTMKDGTVHSFDPRGFQTATVDRNGNTWSYEYDVDGKLTKLTVPGGIQPYDFKYGAATGQLESVTDPAGRRTEFQVDPATNDLLQIRNPDGTSRGFEYDGAHRLRYQTNEAGYRREYQFDAYGRIAKTLSTTRDIWDGSAVVRGQEIRQFKIAESQNLLNDWTGATPPPVPPTELVDPLGNKTVIESMPMGDPTSQTDALLRTTITERDRDGNAVKITRPNGSVVTQQFDSLGNLLARTEETTKARISLTYDPTFNSPLSFVDALGHATSLTRDAANGNVLSVTDALGNVTRFEYTPEGLVSKLTDALGKVTALTYTPDTKNLETVTDPLSHTTRLAYDPAGNVSTVTDAQGRTTTLVYDEFNRVRTSTDADSKVTSFDYWRTGELRTLTDANAHVTSFTYTETGLAASETNAEGQTRRWWFDAARNLGRRIDAKGQETRLVHDVMNRLVSVAMPGDTVTYSYEPLIGSLATAADSDSKLRFEYDPLGRLIKQTTNPDANPSFPQPTTTITNEYDLASNRARLTDPSGRAITYAWDSLARLSTVDGGRGPFQYSYDALSRVTALDMPNGTRTVYTYDEASELKTLDTTVGPTTLFSQALTYTSVGNVDTITDSEGVHQYTYDLVDRLTGATHPIDPPEGFSYDPVGNRLTAAPSPFSWIYSPANRLLDDGANTYTHDANGNLSTKAPKAAPAEVTTYSHDVANRLARIGFPGSAGYATYAYDALGRRIQRNLGGVLTKYVYDGFDLIAEYDDSVGSSRVDLQACKLEYSIVSPK